MPPRVTILSLSPLARDARVLRQVTHALGRYDVSVVAWGLRDDVPAGAELVPVTPVVLPAFQRAAQVLLLAGGRVRPGLFERWYWRKPDHRAALGAVLSTRPDLIHANEAIALPVALAAAGATGARVLFDAHEYSPDQFKDRRLLRVLGAPLYRRLVARAVEADAMVTVAPTIADRYARELGIPCEVILNVPAYEATPFHPTGRPVRLVHHGIALRGRHLEPTILAAAQLGDGYTLELRLVERSPGYVRELRALADRAAPGRVHFVPPVPPAEIVRAVAGADVGIALIPPVDYNYSHALPNKLFEYMMAGLAVAVGPSPEMARLVRDEGCGFVADGFGAGDLARALSSATTADIDVARRRSLDAARRYNADHEMRRLHDIYDRLLEMGPRAVASEGGRRREGAP